MRIERINKESIEKIGEQGNLDFGQAETADEIRKRLIESIRVKHASNKPLDEEELNFWRREMSELDDNPFQNKETSH